jgi:hypothetical protein
VSDHDELRLRAITVSTRAALATGDPARIKARADELLAELETIILRDGADPKILAAIAATRREMWSEDPGET